MWVYSGEGGVWHSCPEPFPSSRFIFCINETEGNSSWREISERPAPESAASNERLVQVSNKRITSFVGFQKISGYLCAHSAAASEPRPFPNRGGRGLTPDPPHPTHASSEMICPSGELTFPPLSVQENKRRSHSYGKSYPNLSAGR